jgi:hypothetical protein
MFGGNRKPEVSRSDTERGHFAERLAEVLEHAKAKGALFPQVKNLTVPMIDINPLLDKHEPLHFLRESYSAMRADRATQTAAHTLFRLYLGYVISHCNSSKNTYHALPTPVAVGAINRYFN